MTRSEGVRMTGGEGLSLTESEGSQWRIPFVIARSGSDEAISCPTEIATPSARNDR